jgi:hypothetical protein
MLMLLEGVCIVSGSTLAELQIRHNRLYYRRTNEEQDGTLQM